MNNYQVVFSKKAQKDINQLTNKQREKLKEIINEVLRVNPYDRKTT